MVVNVTKLLSPVIAAQLLNAAQTKQLLHHLRGEPIDSETAMETTVEEFTSCWGKLEKIFDCTPEIAVTQVTVDRQGLHLVRADVSNEAERTT